MGLVYGVGYNDSNSTMELSGVRCRVYLVWKAMLQRCYSVKWKTRYPTYQGCSVCEEWLTFSKFKSWMETQDWEGKELDKDLLVPGNKVYSPDTCLFVSREVNNFLTKRQLHRGEFPIGVYWKKQNKKFVAQCRNFSNGSEHLGYFSCPKEAHMAWVERKTELAAELSLLQSDPRVSKALLEIKFENWR